MLPFALCLFFYLCRFAVRPQPNGQMLGHLLRSLLPSTGKDLVCYAGKIAPPFFFRLYIQLSFSCHSVVILLFCVSRFGLVFSNIIDSALSELYSVEFFFIGLRFASPYVIAFRGFAPLPCLLFASSPISSFAISPSRLSVYQPETRNLKPETYSRYNAYFFFVLITNS